MNSFVARLTTRKLSLLGFLIALDIVVAKFLSFGIWSVRVSLTFVVVFFMALWFGPLLAGIAAGCADIVGTLIFGGIGGYFFGFTISAFVGAFVYGIFFYQHKPQLWRIIVAVLINVLLIDACLNTFWLMELYHASFWALFPTRIVKELIMIPLQVVLLYFVSHNRTLQSLEKRI
ncbi:folate family ECF transporter S component [Liquorilactobacillus satsumensis]|uniref:Integral membrane protein n=1 Tax=Liquorilactobacillus satsumensis DSM 16230 = JCM 12392 TaxID=1423801 RepID=A0A0R1V3U0_9LACO|nr:folate family ECF transporter S component [Liquorilactobacillus satsumensis]KRM00225.1 hypothetical protein FD50_GL002201 [Liquorilactobacillus satsumensis DSM 16230 = JCM 12392]MCC7665785.1 folate family ECF transporter S component [Liquorilactobacillus satsumensis]MCP9313370.1 folate family ECF transporter S component [Liquorilactobacillus satsumensis]MCP9328201.1 folate family ECF transporter S component [Liquorilactobacillus satsumensis]MCP9356420.1 folate family ECF transporter S compo